MDQGVDEQQPGAWPEIPTARLVFLVNAPGFGGGEQHALNLAAEARRRGADVVVVAPPGAPILARLAERQIPYRAMRLGTNIGRWRGWLGTLLFLNPLAWLWFALRLRQLAREVPSTFICPFPREQILVTWLGAWRGVRAIWIVHSPLTYLPHRWLILPMWRRLARNAGAVVAVSRRLGHDLADDLAAAGAPRERVVVIPNAVPLVAGDTSEVLHDPTLIVVASRLTAPKGVQYLIAAMPQVREQIPAARVAIAGAGNYESTLRALARQAHLGDAIRFVGFLTEPADLLRMAAVCVYPSAEPRETLPTSILEAYALGVPVIASATGGIPDIVEHERTGLLVPPADAAALAQALVMLLSDPSHARRLGNAGQAFVRDRFSMRASGDMFLRLAASLDVALTADFPWESAPQVRPAPKSLPLGALTANFKESGLIRHTTLLLASKVVTALATAWWTILAARVLAPTDYGNLMLCAGLVEIAAIVTDAGVTAVGTREAARAQGDHLRRLTGTLVYLKLGLGLVASGLLVLVAGLVPFGAGVAPLLLIFAPSLVFISLNSLTLVPRARLRIWTVLAVALVSSGLGSAFALLAYIVAPTARAFAEARVIGLLLGGLVALWVIVRHYHPRLTFDPRLAWKLLVASAALGVSLALNIAYYRVDVPLLALLTNARQVAIYTSAYRLLDVVTLVPASAAGIALPLMAALLHPKRLIAFAQQYLDLAMACGLFCAVMLLLLGPTLLHELYAGRYDASWPVLAVLAWAGAATFVTNVFSPLAVVLNQRAALVAATLFGLVANIGLNLALIPRLGAVGPAYATLATEVIVTAPLIWTTLHELRWRVRVRRLLLAGLAAAAALVIGGGLGALGAPWWLGGLAALAIWLPVLARIVWSDLAGLRENWRVASMPHPAIVLPRTDGHAPAAGAARPPSSAIRSGGHS